METDSSTAWIGIDLGDRKHAVCVLAADGEIIREHFIAGSRLGEAPVTRVERRYAAHGIVGRGTVG